MLSILAAIGKKFTGLALIFNSIVSLLSVANLLVAINFNSYGWQPYSPYLIHGLFLWFVVLSAILNIIPAKLIGEVKLKRVFFHHYVYGLLASLISLFMIAIFAPAYMFVLLSPSIGFEVSGYQIMPVYAGVTCVYGGLTLIIDDVRDISIKISKVLDRLKVQAFKSVKALQILHLCSSLISIYIAACIAVWCIGNSLNTNLVTLDITQVIFFISLLITGLWGLKAVKAKMWFTRIYSDL